MENDQKERQLSRILIVGFGSIGQALVPLLFRHFPSLQGGQVTVVAADDQGRTVAQTLGLDFHAIALTRDNHVAVLEKFLGAGDFLVNVSVDVSSCDLIRWCQNNDVLYLDTCIEPWKGGYDDAIYPAEQTTNGWLRSQALSLRGKGRPTCVVAHGANPGLASHFVAQGLFKLAHANGIDASQPFAAIAQTLGIRSIHIAERDTQNDGFPLNPGEFVNTWSPSGLLSEAFQHAELGWGTHEQGLPEGAILGQASSGVVLEERSATVRINSWVPAVGPQQAYLITHHESLSIAEWLTVREPSGALTYRPTVLYAYHPSEQTCQSLEQWVDSGFTAPEHTRLMRDAIQGGYDELGVLFVYEGGAYWYGSTLTYGQAAAMAPWNNATSLPVCASIVAAMQWALRHPYEGVVEAEDLPHEEILSMALPYLGTVHGVATGWQPAEKGCLTFPDFLESIKHYEKV